MKSILLFLLGWCAVETSLAQTGISVPEMKSTDTLIKRFLATYDIPGATVAIAKDGRIVYMRAFGYADINKTEQVQPYHLFRIASLSKPITSIAIMWLMQQGRLSLSDKVFGDGGILDKYLPLSGLAIKDARVYDITVQQLLEHTAGWDRDGDCNPDPSSPYPYFLDGCDPISFPLRVTMLQGASNPATKNNLVRFVLEKGLDYTPGSKYNYSNMGYLMLGDIIEQVTGMNYETYVRDTILAPLGIYDIRLGRNLLKDKLEREGEYVGNGYTTLSCYGDSSYVPWEYGGFNLEAMDAHGGWIASSADLLRLLAAIDGFAAKPDILNATAITAMTTPSVQNPYYAKGWAVNSANNWWHTGSLDGTASQMVRSNNGYTWIIICNKTNVTNPNFWPALDNLGWSAISTTSTWPSWDLMESPTKNATEFTRKKRGASALKLKWKSGNGNRRIVIAKEATPVDRFPLDGSDYAAHAKFGHGTDLGNGNFAVYNGTGNSTTITGLAKGKVYHFRIIEFNKNTITGENALYLLGDNPVVVVP